MFLFYDVIFILFSILYLPFFLFKGKAHKGFFQRWGFFPKELENELKNKNNIWVHAVSVGEVQAVSSLLDFLRNNYPSQRIVISTVTPAGNKLAQSFVKGNEVVIYFPLDFSFVVKKFIKIINPKIFITTETEIWPNLLLAFKKKQIPAILVNGRISEASFKGYKFIMPFIKGALNSIKLFCMQTEIDAKRIKEIGAESRRIAVTGNLKFDAKALQSKYQRSDLCLETSGLLLIAGSTHAGEEEIIIDAYKNLSGAITNLKLLIAPRHIERCKEIEEILSKNGINHARFSELFKKTKEAPVILLDTIGDLSSLYSLADVIFMGGSLMKKGGHNIIEPAMYAKPVVFGQFMFNFKQIAQMFLERGAAIKVNNSEELLVSLKKLLLDKTLREKIGNLAKKIVDENTGATARTGDLIKENFS